MPESNSLPDKISMAVLEEAIQIQAQNKIDFFYPDTGPLRRELYRKHLKFFAAGKEYRERMMMAGNRTGKSTVGAYETTVHLTGRYPAWWEGKRFDHPISCIVSGDTNLTVSGGTSHMKLRSFEQGREAFQGTEEDLIWLDENFPQEIYSECITRLMTTNGHLLMTFTPINGVTPIIREFMEKAARV